MATKQGFYTSGKLGNTISYVVDGQQRERSMPTHVANPNTEAQQAHRSAFLDIVRLSSYMTEALKIGLHYIACRKHTKPYLYFRSINKDCFTPDGQIDYPRVVLSDGSIARVHITSVTMQLDNPAIIISFDPCYSIGNAKPNDEFYLYAYCPAHSTGHLFTPVPRSACELTVALPADWFHPATVSQAIAQLDNHSFDIHLYAFLRSPRGLTSPTIYIPLTQ